MKIVSAVLVIAVGLGGALGVIAQDRPLVFQVGAELVVLDVIAVDDAGHYVIEDAYERIVPLVEQFLVQHPLEVDARSSGATRP